MLVGEKRQISPTEGFLRIYAALLSFHEGRDLSSGVACTCDFPAKFTYGVTRKTNNYMARDLLITMSGDLVSFHHAKSS